MPGPLDGLNRSQLQAVTHPGGPLLVVAGAGTGKTRTVTARFAWLVEQGAAPDEGLALTFSTPAPLLASFVSRIDRLKDEMVSAADYRAYAERLIDEAGGGDDAARAKATR